MKLLNLILTLSLASCASAQYGTIGYQQLGINPSDLTNEQKLRLLQLQLVQQQNFANDMRNLNQANENLMHFIESDAGKW